MNDTRTQEGSPVTTPVNDITLRNISKRYGAHQALADVSLHAASGELLTLLGPSGCGKTTLLRTIAGLEIADSGEIFIAGRDITTESPARRDVGFVFQNYALFPHLNVFDNISFGLRNRKKTRDEIAQRVAELLELIGLRYYAARFPSQLSGGQRQRVALARALATEPRILLLDEPFAALDVQTRKELRSWLRELHERTHVTSIVVTHDPDEAMEIADTIALMDHGRIQQVGNPQELYESPTSLFAMKFLGPVSMLQLQADGDPLYVRPHDLRIELADFPGALQGEICSIARRGPSVQLAVRLGNGSTISAEISADRMIAWQPAIGDHVFVGPTESRSRTFLQSA